MNWNLDTISWIMYPKKTFGKYSNEIKTLFFAEITGASMFT